MITETEKKILPYVRWIALILGAFSFVFFASIAFLLLFFVGGGPYGKFSYGNTTVLPVILVIMADFPVVWMWEGVGALMIIVGYIGLGIIFRWGWFEVHPLYTLIFIIFPIVGLMHGWCWFIIHQSGCITTNNEYLSF